MASGASIAAQLRRADLDYSALMAIPDLTAEDLHRRASARLCAVYGAQVRVDELLKNIKLGFRLPNQLFLNAIGLPFDARTRLLVAGMAGQLQPLTQAGAARSLAERMTLAACDRESELRPVVNRQASALALRDLLGAMQSEAPLRLAYRLKYGSDLEARHRRLFWPAAEAAQGYLTDKLRQATTLSERQALQATMALHGLHEADPETRPLQLTSGQHAQFNRLYDQAGVPAPVRLGGRSAEVIAFPNQRLRRPR